MQLLLHVTLCKCACLYRTGTPTQLLSSATSPTSMATRASCATGAQQQQQGSCAAAERLSACIWLRQRQQQQGLSTSSSIPCNTCSACAAAPTWWWSSRRGYPIQELTEASYLESAYLVLYGNLPTRCAVLCRRCCRCCHRGAVLLGCWQEAPTCLCRSLAPTGICVA